jgi:hypothetical protein
MTSYMSCGSLTGWVAGQGPNHVGHVCQSSMGVTYQLIRKNRTTGMPRAVCGRDYRCSFRPSIYGEVSTCNDNSEREPYVGNVIVVRIPPPHCFLGRSNVSSPVQGAPPKGSCFLLLKHLWQSCFCWPVFERSMASPTIMRNPYRLLLSYSPMTHVLRITLAYLWEGSDLGLAIIWRDIVHRDAFLS